MARLLAGAAVGAPFLDPVEVTGAGQLHPGTGVDLVAAATLRFPTGLVAQVSASLGVEQDNTLRVYGTHGMLRVPAPYHPSCGVQPAHFFLHRQGREETISVVAPSALYELEADAFANAVAQGFREVPAMTVADSLGNMATLDRWRDRHRAGLRAGKAATAAHSSRRDFPGQVALRKNRGPLVISS
jgi:predicted dehydrogenase